MARWAPLLIVLLGILILVVALVPRVDWSNPRDRMAAMIVIAVVVVGMLLGILAGRFSFNNTMHNWETFEVELTPTELIRQLRGQEVRIQRANLRSIREYPRRGFVIVDNLGWQIFVPSVIQDYESFRREILNWKNLG